MNLHDTITHKRLKTICDKNAAKIFSKVRIADILPIENSGINSSEFRFALSGHFDFVVTNSDFDPLFAVEFDGPYHDSNDNQKRRDALKDSIVKFLIFPYLEFVQTIYRLNMMAGIF